MKPTEDIICDMIREVLRYLFHRSRCSPEAFSLWCLDMIYDDSVYPSSSSRKVSVMLVFVVVVYEMVDFIAMLSPHLPRSMC
jgi:hypothetical protein